MNNRLEFLLKTSPEEVVSTWESMGSLNISNDTKIYIKDSIFKVAEAKSPLYGAIIYCEETYTVSEENPLIDWTQMNDMNIEAHIGTYQGVASPYFRILLKKSSGIESSGSAIPFQGAEEPEQVIIDDEQLGIILGECGVPFLTVNELELTRSAIVQYCIKPALDTYYSFFPIIREENVGDLGAGGSFKKEFPKDAFHAVAYYVLGTNGGGGSGASNAFSFCREQMIYGGGIGCGTGGNFGTGISYRKAVPGYVGLQSKDAALQGLQAAQAYTNYFRREKVKVVKEDNKKYATGYSTVGGCLQIKWLCRSYDWEDVDYTLLTDARELCTAKVLRNLGMLRTLVKSDVPGTIDYSIYNSRADTLEQKVRDKWNSSPTNWNLAIQRGGL